MKQASYERTQLTRLLPLLSSIAGEIRDRMDTLRSLDEWLEELDADALFVPFEHSLQEVLLAAERVVEAGLAHTEACLELAGGGGANAVLPEELEGCVQCVVRVESPRSTRLVDGSQFNL